MYAYLSYQAQISRIMFWCLWFQIKRKILVRTSSNIRVIIFYRYLLMSTRIYKVKLPFKNMTNLTSDCKRSSAQGFQKVIHQKRIYIYFQRTYPTNRFFYISKAIHKAVIDNKHSQTITSYNDCFIFLTYMYNLYNIMFGNYMF